MKKTALQKAISHAGSQSALAERLGVDRRVVGNWIARGQVPAEQCLRIAAAVDMKISPRDLRPDVFAAQ